MSTTAGGKYTVGEGCRWCGGSPAREYVLQKNRVKGVTYRITELACRTCARRLGLDDDES